MLIWLLIWKLNGQPHTIGVYPDLGTCFDKIAEIRAKQETSEQLDLRCYAHRDALGNQT